MLIQQYYISQFIIYPWTLVSHDNRLSNDHKSDFFLGIDTRDLLLWQEIHFYVTFHYLVIDQKDTVKETDIQINNFLILSSWTWILCWTWFDIYCIYNVYIYMVLWCYWLETISFLMLQNKNYFSKIAYIL